MCATYRIERRSSHRTPGVSRSETWRARRPRVVRSLLATGLLIAVVTGLATVPASAGELTYFGALGMYEGSYELSVDTSTLYLLNGFTYESGRWSVTASIPVYDQDSPYVTWTGGSPVVTGRRFGMDGTAGSGSGSTPMGSHSGSRRGPVEVPDPATLDFSETGLGDPLVRADVAFTRTSDQRVGCYASAKIPVADEDSGFGTGEWDFGLGLSLLRAAGPGELLLEVGWWSLGDLPDLELEDPLTATVAYGTSPEGRRIGWRAFAVAWSEILDGQDGPAQVGVTLGRGVGDTTELSLTMSAGLTDASADWGLAFGWKVRPSS